MLPDNLIDIVLQRAHQTDEALVEALQDASTYRFMTHVLLTQLYTQQQLRKHTEARLRQLMGLDTWRVDD